MKLWKVLILISAMCFLSLFLVACGAHASSTNIKAVPNVWTYDWDNYNNIYLNPNPQDGDHYFVLYNDPSHINSITTSLLSETPTGATFQVGYVYPIDGTPHYNVVITSGSGPTSSVGQAWCFWHNQMSIGETFNGRVSFWTDR